MVDVELKKRGVYLGKTGETGRYRVWLDVSAWDEEYEGGVGLLLYTDPKGNTAPMRTVKEFDGEKTKLYGYVTAEETKEAGTGVIEARWENAGVVAKSDHFNTVVMASSYTGKNIGDNTPDWVRDLMTELNAVNVVLDEAAQVAEDVAAIRETIEGAETVAKAAALDAEAWAVGERDGEDVDEDDPTYGNNARKYAQDAGGSATFAQIERQTAEAWAVGKRNGQDVGSTDPAYHNNAKYYSELAFSGTPEGYADLVGDVGDLKSAIDIIGTSDTEGTPAHWVSGGLNTSMTGTNTNTARARISGAYLERLPSYGVVSVEIPSTLLCRVAVYTDRNFSTVVARITGYSGAESTRTNGSVKIPSEYNGLYLGMDCKKVDDTDFTAEEIAALTNQIVIKHTTVIGDLSNLETDDKASVVGAINENKNAIDEINGNMYESSNAEYTTDSTYTTGFRSGYFSSAGQSKTDGDYSRNAFGIVIDDNCKSISITPKENVTLNYCIFSAEPSFAMNANNSDILIANGGGFVTGERIINNPPAGLLYVSHKISTDNLTAADRPAIVLSSLRFNTAKEYETLGYTRDYTDITWQLNFERKQISETGIEDSTTHVIAKLPNIGCVEVRMNTPAGKFAVFKDTNGTITKLCDYTTYQYRIFADYVSDYYIDIVNINVTTLTIASARKYALVYSYDDTGSYRKTEYKNKLFGMNIAFIGDSITQGRFHKEGSNEDTDGTNYTMSKPYPVLVAEISGDRNVMNFGIGGALVYDSDWKSLYRNCGNVAGFDYVFVHAGTNDYGNNTPAEAFTSAYNYVISTLKANNTNVVVLTPVTRTNRTSKNTENLYLKDYADIEKTIAEQQSCNVIDLLTLTNNSTFKSLLSDGLHPDEMGHAYIADLILKGM